MKHLQDCAVYSSDFRFNLEDQTYLLSYKCKKNDCVLLLSIFNQEPVVDQHTEQKVPGMIRDYNATKGGGDKADKMVATYTVKYISRRWYTIVFYVLNMSGINSYVQNCEVDPTWGRDKPHKRRQFLRCLGEALVKPLLESKKVARPITKANVDAERTQRKRDRCQLCGQKRDWKTRKFVDGVRITVVMIIPTLWLIYFVLIALDHKNKCFGYMWTQVFTKWNDDF